MSRHQAAGDAEIAATLADGLSRQWDTEVMVQDLQREALSSSSSFRTERLRVRLTRGDRAGTRETSLRVFFKDLHPGQLLTKARVVRGFDLEPSRREIEMYRTVLSPERVGTLHLYASRWEPDQGRIWLMLEDGGRVLLNNFVDLPRWIAAARWAARFHATTTALPEAQTAFLPRYDEEHYRRCAERVGAILPGLAGSERELVKEGLARFRSRIHSLGDLPRSVIHGQYFGKNILLRRGARAAAPQVVVIDWETAALGPGTVDLVSLTSGKWTTEAREAMRAAYYDEYRAFAPDPPGWSDFRAEIETVALYRALEWLAWWGGHRTLSRHFARFMLELELVLAEEAGTPPV
jgi:hypothetical protein